MRREEARKAFRITKEKKKHDIGNIVVTVVAIVLLIIVVPLLAMCITLAARSGDDLNPPTIFGYAPLVVASGSMSGEDEGCFDEGDLIFVKVLDDEAKMELEVGDVITFRDSRGSSAVLTTHRIIAISGEGEGMTFTTHGDANGAGSNETVALSAVYGVVAGKIGGFGGFADFVTTPWGIICVVVIPVLILVVLDLSFTLYKRRKSPEEKIEGDAEEGNKDLEIEERDEEIARLRAMLDEKEDSDGKGGKSDDET